MKAAMRRGWLLMGAVVLVAAGGVLAVVKFEGEVPSLSVTPEPKAVGREATFTVTAEDRRSGLSEVRAVIQQSGRTSTLLAEAFPSGTHKVQRNLTIAPEGLSLVDGEAMLRVEARDRSWRGGNPNVLEAKVQIDTRPPTLSILSRFHYINQGGAGVVVFRASEPLIAGAVEVGGRRFPGYNAGPDNGWAVLFAVPHDASPKVQISLVGEDLAGNRTRTSFPYQIRTKTFRKDSIRLSEDFLQRILPYFMDRDPNLRGEPGELFLRVNRDLRKANEATIQDLCRESAPSPLWSGAFLRMANAKPMAGFADRRSYILRDREIDQQTHLGVDLASLTMSPLEAANHGRVVFSGELGIYGKTVLLDHGYGLFSMYGHLSQISVKAGQQVRKGEIIGTSGDTGLAGGDHLHFSMLVGGVYVNPIEWWDSHWMADNVDGKLSLLKAHGG